MSFILKGFLRSNLELSDYTDKKIVNFTVAVDYFSTKIDNSKHRLILVSSKYYLGLKMYAFDIYYHVRLERSNVTPLCLPSFQSWTSDSVSRPKLTTLIGFGL